MAFGVSEKIFLDQKRRKQRLTERGMSKVEKTKFRRDEKIREEVRARIKEEGPEKIEARKILRTLLGRVVIVEIIEEYVRKPHIWRNPRLDGTPRSVEEVAIRAIEGFVRWLDRYKEE